MDLKKLFSSPGKAFAKQDTLADLLGELAQYTNSMVEVFNGRHEKVVAVLLQQSNALHAIGVLEVENSKRLQQLAKHLNFTFEPTPIDKDDETK